MFRSMWGTALGVGLLAAIHPMRIAMILLMICRPRPMQNLIAYSGGGLIVAVPALLVGVVVVHSTAVAKPATGPSSSASPTQIGMGVFLLSIAGLMTVRFAMRARQQAHLPTSGGNTSTQVLDSNAQPAISRLPGRALLGRVRDGWNALWVAWANGSLWVAVVFGLIMAPADGILFVFTLLLGSTAPIGTQVGAAIAFVAGWLALAEVILVTYLVTPAKTQAALRLLHNWIATYQRQVMVGIFVLAGLASIAKGMRIF